MSDSELNHLISLLDDPDENIWHPIRDSILNQGNTVLSLLQEHWQNCNDPLLATRIQDLISSIQFGEQQKDWKNWYQNSIGTIKEGIVLINRIIEPEFCVADIDKLIKQIYNDVWIELNDGLTALEKIRVLNYMFFEKHKFNCKNRFQFKAKHLFLTNLLLSNTGHPLTIASLYSLLCRELSIPVFKVGNSEHSGLAYLDTQDMPFQIIPKIDSIKILFFILPDKHGEIVGQRQFLENYNKEYPGYLHDLKVISDKQFIRIILQELQFYFKEEKNELQLSKLNHLLQIIPQV